MDERALPKGRRTSTSRQVKSSRLWRLSGRIATRGGERHVLGSNVDVQRLSKPTRVQLKSRDQ
jgi:hypothetical protein